MEFWAFWPKQKCFLKPFLIKTWRHYGRGFCSWKMFDPKIPILFTIINHVPVNNNGVGMVKQVGSNCFAQIWYIEYFDMTSFKDHGGGYTVIAMQFRSNLVYRALWYDLIQGSWWRLHRDCYATSLYVVQGTVPLLVGMWYDSMHGRNCVYVCLSSVTWLYNITSTRLTDPHF